MSTHKHFSKICCVVLVLTLLLTGWFMNAKSFGVEETIAQVGYENRLFDTSIVHSIDIGMYEWERFLQTCESEEYASCTVVIDGEAYKNVGIRAKGNTSLSQVKSYDNDRYSFKIEFDHYDSANTYYGLDKLCLNNIIQDNTYMKDYLTYQLMGEFGVAAPLCSYVYITVNGDPWGLYLAVEGVENSFLERNYGTNYGELYKPDNMDMGGGRGNGRNFNMEDQKEFTENAESDIDFRPDEGMPFDQNDGDMQMPGGPGGMMPPDQNGGDMQMPGGGRREENRGMGGQSMGSSDVSLIYSDDEYDSYSNIFDSAKTKITDADKTRLIAALKNINENTDLETSVDTEAVIRYFVVHNFVLNFDSYTGSMIHNYYLYEEDGTLSMIPWDYNLAFGGFQSAGNASGLVNYPIDTPVSGGTVDSRPMLAWILNNEEYTEMYHQLFAEFISEYFESGKVEEMISSVKEMISPYVEADPTKFCTYEEFLTGIDTLKEFCALRAESVSGQLEGIIGSTSDTQSRDTLIAAEDITVSDMGTMNMGMGGGRDGQRSEDTDSMEFRKNGGQRPEEVRPAMNMGGDRPQGGDTDKMEFGPQTQQNSGNMTFWIWIAASAAVLIFGLAFAILFVRRKS